MAVKVLIAFSNSLFSRGVARLLEDEDEIEVAEILTICSDPPKTEKLSEIDVILVDLPTLYNRFGEVPGSAGRNYILFDTCCGEENITSAVITRGVKGLILADTSTDLLKKAILAVARGEVWLDKSTVKNLVTGMNALKRDSGPPLTTREKEIVALVGKGYKNREIACKLHISEPTVKTHLNRIFQKLDVRNRPQLISYALKNPDITNHTLN